MPDHRFQPDGARVLADLTALRGIGAYKTGGHKPTFSDPHLSWLEGPIGVGYALEAGRVLNPDPDVKGAVEVAAWCDEEGHFGSFLGSRSFVGGVSEADIDAARDRSSERTMRQALAG